jgi:hypothetical protein
MKKLIAAGILCTLSIGVSAQSNFGSQSDLGEYGFEGIHIIVPNDLKIDGRIFITGEQEKDTGSLDALITAIPLDFSNATGISAESRSFALRGFSPAGYGAYGSTFNGTGVRGTAYGFSNTGIGVEAISRGRGAALRISGGISKDNQPGHHISLYDSWTNEIVATYRFMFHFNP